MLNTRDSGSHEVSGSQLTASHQERLAIGRSGPMTIVVAENSRRVLTVRVLRSRFIQTEGQVGYLTTFTIEEASAEMAAQLVGELLESGRLQIG